MLDMFFGVPEMAIAIDSPIAGRFIMENPIKMDDLGVPPFQEMPLSDSIYIVTMV